MKPITRRKAYTTGQAARLLECAARTVSAWVDRGDLEGYRLPGSKDRRVLHDSLVRFMRDVLGMPLPPELGEPPAPKPPLPEPPPPEPPLLLGVDGVARLLSESAHAVRRLSKAGRLPQPLLLGVHLRWVRAEVLDAVERMRREARESLLGQGRMELLGEDS